MSVVTSSSSSSYGDRNRIHPEGLSPRASDPDVHPRGNPKSDSLRKRIYNTFDDPSYSKPAKVISVVMMLIILISTLAFILESELLVGGALYDVRDDAQAVFAEIERVCVILFTIDYTMRLLTCPKICPFFWNIMNLIDLAAVMPFWVMLVVNTASNTDNSGNFGFIRVIRLIRVFRVFKFGRYSIGLQMFAGALKGSVQPLGILVFVMSINMIILSSIVHICELAVSADDIERHGSDSETHLRCYGTISRTFWWAMVTMTTVGYGDCSPLSPVGKLFAIIAMLSGVLILALPITVIGSNFAKMVEMFEDDAAVYSVTDLDGDGLVDMMELREFLARKKKEGVLRRDVDTRVSTLMEKYDPQGNGMLSMPEFLQLQRDIVDSTTLDPAVEIHDMHSQIVAQERQLSALTQVVDRRMAAIESFIGAMAQHIGARPQGVAGQATDPSPSPTVGSRAGLGPIPVAGSLPPMGAASPNS